MINFITLENYRNILNKKQFSIKPITLFVGPNNSGKSSLIKSLLLLKDNCGDFENLIFQNGIHKLGNFNTLCSNTNKNKSILFELPFFLFGADTIRLIYEGRKNSISNGRLIELCIFNSKNNLNFLKVEKIEYAGDSDKIYNFNWKINYLAIYAYFMNEKYFDWPKLDTSNFLTSDWEKDWDKRTDPHKINFNLDLPIFDFELPNDAKPNHPFKHFSNADIAFLELLENKNTTHNPNPENGHPSIFTELKQIIYNHYRGESGIYSTAISNFKSLNKLLSINPTPNGKAFFEMIISNIDFAFKSLQRDLKELYYLNSSSTRQERIHIEKDGSHFQNILTRFLELERKDREYLTNWMRKLELISNFEEVQIKNIAQAGYEIILKNKKTNTETNLADCGFGVTQVLTLLLEFAIDENKQYLIEEPEANLHPALQSKLAELFCVNLPGRNFIIETHSEYMVRKFQHLVANKELNPKDIIIHYFWKDDDKAFSKQIDILPNGQLSESFEKGFYDESVNLKFELLKLIKAQNN
jgi:predicted ATPase